LLIVLLLLAWAPQQAMQVALTCVWAGAALWVAGLGLYHLSRALFL
jgi:hypothetical protein